MPPSLGGKSLVTTSVRRVTVRSRRGARGGPKPRGAALRGPARANSTGAALAVAGGAAPGPRSRAVPAPWHRPDFADLTVDETRRNQQAADRVRSQDRPLCASAQAGSPDKGIVVDILDLDDLTEIGCINHLSIVDGDTDVLDRAVEEDQVTSPDLGAGDIGAHAVLGRREVRKLHPRRRPGQHRQAGTVHTGPAGAAPHVWHTEVRVRGLDGSLGGRTGWADVDRGSRGAPAGLLHRRRTE